MELIQLLISGIAAGAIYGTIAIGIVLIYKATGVINFAQGEMVMICTFVAWSLYAQVHLPLLVAIALSLLFAAVFGFVLERVFIHPFLRSSFLVTAITTLALFLILGWVAIRVWGTTPRPFPSVFPATILHLGGVAVGIPDIGVVVVVALVAIVLSAFFNRTRFGIAMRGTADNALAARLCGINVGTVNSMTWVVAAMVASVGGIMVAPITYVSYEMMIPYLMKAFAAAVIGGFDSLPGAMVGGVLLGVAENLVGGYVSSDMKGVLPFLLIVVFLLLHPAGLFGKPLAVRV